MAAVLRGDSTDGDVIHLRVPPDLKAIFKAVADLRGRSMTQHLLLTLEEAHLGPREVRLLNERRGKN